jgi:hypothetical protein
MRFERELKPLAEYVRASTLKLGDVYFTVGFADEAMLIPSLEPVVFIGSDIERSGEEKAYFQDICAYQYGMRFDAAGEKDAWAFQAFHVGKGGIVNGVCEYEQALDVLLRCANRRREIAQGKK